MITKKGRFLIRHKEIDSKYIESFDFDKLEDKYQDIKKFYSFEKDLGLIRICFIYSPEEFLFFTGREFNQNWICAMVGYHNTINIFSPSIIEKITTHKKESIFNTIVHEISHLFYGYSMLADFPLFNEGIAKYHENNKCNNKINFNLPSLKGGKDSIYDYGVGHLIVCSIMEHFGNEGAKKIIKFLKESSTEMSEEELFNLFKKIFEIDVDLLIELKGGKEK
ncbi:hypothetical protein GYA25_00345 [Candidatus Woesearchaeota archaeon]|jgi:hypothetical protein|nr:hypothetical protein [Candidatus Woesearchaeota archaeon]